MSLDYVASYKESHGDDILHFGVKGMKWGVRKDLIGIGRLAGPHAGGVVVGTNSPKDPTVEERAAVTATVQRTASKLTKPTSDAMLATKLYNRAAAKRGLSNEAYNAGLTSLLSEQATKIVKKEDKNLEAFVRATETHITMFIGNPSALADFKTTFKMESMSSDGIHQMSFNVTRDENGYVTDLNPGAIETFISHHGVKGMKWGVRRDSVGSARGKKLNPTRARKKEDKNIARAKEVARLQKLKEDVLSGKTTLAVGDKKVSTAQAVKALDKRIEANAKRNPIVKKQEELKPAPKKSEKDVEEVTLSDGTKLAIEKTSVSTMDFNALKVQVREKGANSLTDDELKYVNARTEAVRKANEAYKQPDSWLSKTVKSTVRSTFDQQLKKTTDVAANHFGDIARKKLKDRLNTRTKKATATTAAGSTLPVVYKVTKL